MTPDFRRMGAAHFEGAFDHAQWLPQIEALPQHVPGLRLVGHPWLHDLVGQGSVANQLANEALASTSHPVRALLFDKSIGNNWPLGWHQDRVIAVQQRHEVAGYGPWTRKGEFDHVQPPRAILEDMVTLRLHFDDVDLDNAPLRIVPGSHRKGSIADADYAAVVAQLGEQICEAKAGDIWVYSTPILHASSPAVQPSRRRVLQVDYAVCSLPLPLAWLGI